MVKHPLIVQKWTKNTLSVDTHPYYGTALQWDLRSRIMRKILYRYIARAIKNKREIIFK